MKPASNPAPVLPDPAPNVLWLDSSRIDPHDIVMSPNMVVMEILRWAVRASLPVAVDESPPFDALKDVDWHRLLWLGRQTRGLLFLHHAIVEKRAERWCPPDVRAQLAALHSAAQFQGLVRAKELCLLHDLFAAGKIPFIAIDDWLFEQSFANARNTTEKADPVRVLVAPADIAHARAVLATTGWVERTEPFQVVSPGHTPVALVADDTARLGRSTLPLGSRLLAAPSPGQWLQLLAREAATRSEIDLVHAWQVALLETKSEGHAVLTDPVAVTGIARCRLACGLAIEPSLAPSLSPSPTVQTAANLPFAPYVPTPPHIAERMLALADTKPGDKVFDLGCGDGRILIAAAKKFGACGIGIDRDPALIARATVDAAAEGISERTTFLCGDLFSADLTDASVICLYLLPSFYAPVRERLLSRARPGTRVVSHDYFFPQWVPERTELIRTERARISQIYLWRLP